MDKNNHGLELMLIHKNVIFFCSVHDLNPLSSVMQNIRTTIALI